MPDPAQPPDPAGSVDHFAELSALLADPFADRAAILCEAGLDAERWREVEERWAGRLQKGGAVAERFAAVYDTTLRALAAPVVPLARAGHAPDGGPRSSSPEARASSRLGPGAAGRAHPTEPRRANAEAAGPEPPVRGEAGDRDSGQRSVDGGPATVTPDVELGAPRSTVPLRPQSSPPNPFGETLEAATRLPVPGRGFSQS